MTKVSKKKATERPAAGKRKSAPAKANAKSKAAKPKASKKAAAQLPIAPFARLETFAPAPKKPLALPVKASTAKPVQPVSVRRRSWLERTVPSR